MWRFEGSGAVAPAGGVLGRTGATDGSGPRSVVAAGIGIPFDGANVAGAMTGVSAAGVAVRVGAATPAGGVCVRATLGIPACDDHNQPGTTGTGPIPMNRIGRERVSCARAYLDPARDRPNLTVQGDSLVRRIIVRRSVAVGVELTDGTMIGAARVIVCAGVVQNPPLLWRSGVGPADVLRSLGVEPVVDLPGVGANLGDHVVVTFANAVAPGLVTDDEPAIQTILRTTASAATDTMTCS